jgi:galactitol PTS system EIIB component
MADKRTYRILAFCASGVATSTLLAKTAQSRLEDLGYRVETDTCGPGSIASRMDSFDLLLTTADPKSFKIPAGKPVIRAIPFLTGVGEDECVEEIVNVLKGLK